MGFLFRCLLAISVAGLFLTFFVEGSYSAKCAEVQPIVRDPKADTGWRMAGPPEKFIGVPEAAYVTQSIEGIPRQVDVNRLQSSPGIQSYSPIERTIRYARLGAVACLILALVGLRILATGLRFSEEPSSEN